MDHENREVRTSKTREELRAERLKYARIQRCIRMGAILLAIILAFAALMQSCAVKRAVDDLAAQIQAKQEAPAQLQAARETQSPAAAPASAAPRPGGATVTLSFVGNCTFGQQEDADPFTKYYEDRGASYFFQNVKSLFEGDDLTVANLESTFTLSDTPADKELTYRADPSCADILSTGGVDAVSIANDHRLDYGPEGYVDTLANLDKAGVARFGGDKTLILDVGSVSVGLTGINLVDAGETGEEQLLESIHALKSQGAEIIVAEIHWGQEDGAAPGSVHTALAHSAVDAGADLVVGHHPHTVQAIELYQGKYIAYSLGDFCTTEGGADYDTVILQQTFHVVNGACQPDAALSLIPCSISSEPQENTLCPTPAAGDAADRILDKIYTLSATIEGGIARE